MKMRHLIAIICFFSTINSLNAQIYFGSSTAINFPTANYTEVDYGGGVDIIMGYSFKKKIDIHISGGSRWMSSFIGGYKINSIELGANYYFTNWANKPFVGIGGGYSKKILELPFNNERTDSNVGIKPCIGFLFDLEKVKGLYIKSNFSYTKVFTDVEISMYGINVGLLYYFSKK